jgi:hypothetical protein
VINGQKAERLRRERAEGRLKKAVRLSAFRLLPSAFRLPATDH